MQEPQLLAVIEVIEQVELEDIEELYIRAQERLNRNRYHHS